MKWLKPYADNLVEDDAVKFRFPDKSMQPDILVGQEVTVSPVDPGSVGVGAHIICRLQRGDFFYKVLELGEGRCKVGSPKRVAGWVQNNEVLGKVTKVTN
jgi:hypothetical protein